MGKRYDIDSENFNLFFEQQLQNLNENSKTLLPKDVLFKLFKKGGNNSDTSTSRLRGIEKIYVLWKALNFDCAIVLLNQKDGIGADDFNKIMKHYSPNKGTEDSNKISSSFILADKELSETIAEINKRNNSPAYKYAIGAKNNKSKNGNWKVQANYLTRLLANYEANKKRWVMDTGLTIPEWYVLIYLYDSRPHTCSIIYKEYYRHAYTAGAGQIRGGFSLLQKKGLIIKKGVTKGATFQITALGSDMVNDILAKYVLNI